MSEKYFSDVVRLRNQQKSKYFLNQEYDLTIEMQKDWFEKYIERDDDIYWVVCNKNGDVIGTQRVYNITSNKCGQGSTIIDEEFSRKGPYAAESMLMALNFAFDVIGVSTIVNDDRDDNANMNSITKKNRIYFYKTN